MEGTAIVVIKEGHVRRGMFKDMEDVGETGTDEVIGRGEGKGDAMWEKLDRVGDACTACLGRVDSEAAIRFQGGAKVPAVAAVGGPGTASGGFVMDDNFATRWSNWGSFEVVGAPNLRICGQVGVDAGAMEEV